MLSNTLKLMDEFKGSTLVIENWWDFVHVTASEVFLSTSEISHITWCV